MSNVNTRIQDFYYKGRQDGINDVLGFLYVAADRLKYSKNRDEVASRFIETMIDIMDKDLGYKYTGPSMEIV